MQDPYATPEPSSSALITIDMQNDFTLEDAPARILGTLEVVPAIKRTILAFRAARRPIIHVVRLYKADGSNVDICRRALIESGAMIARPDSSGAELVADLKSNVSTKLDAPRLLAGEFQNLALEEWVLYKSRWSAFHETALDNKLRELGITTIVMTGCNFPNCPRSTIYDASNRDYRIGVVTDAMSGLYDKGLQELSGISVKTFGSDQIASWLGTNM
ncbi:cysteine hydrolase family protein [Tardiphaga robiniae]|uniref:Cysteine hydrolase n=1 Tax=Tardiphaga robiniae TaxID=943830 RepID=A0A7G6U923_9BRAD|nr:isochorismatase family cysteine hydrolase [Tardiphaga robiniae]QND75505.1 cysteine hydrolase [Tardiphaga robiniae]